MIAQTQGDTLGTLPAILIATLGVLISIVLPILRKSLPQSSAAGLTTLWSRVWAFLAPYVPWAIVSLLVAILLVAFAGDTFDQWGKALIAGYAWDSTLQKISGKP